MAKGSRGQTSVAKEAKNLAKGSHGETSVTKEAKKLAKGSHGETSVAKQAKKLANFPPGPFTTPLQPTHFDQREEKKFKSTITFHSQYNKDFIRKFDSKENEKEEKTTTMFLTGSATLNYF